MSPYHFHQCNTTFGPPSDLAESQCHSIPAYLGQVKGGSVDGSTIVIVAWQPSDEQRYAIAQGGPIFLSMIGGLAPHFLSTNFAEANNPA